MGTTMKSYLTNSLTHASEEYKLEMLKMRELLKQKYEVLEYLGLVNGNATDVFRNDIECVRSCDILLAEVSYPSTGQGFEIASALDLDKKVLAFAKQNAVVTRMILGINYPNFKFERYSSLDDVLNLLSK
jgi:nucleoside 2-deoxyribosyltransferase